LIWRDSSTHIVKSPLEFMRRLAALVPRPRLHLTHFHGVLAPHAGLRAAIVLDAADKPGGPASEHVHGQRARLGQARLLKRVFRIDLEHCPRCSGTLNMIAAIEEAAAIARILTHPAWLRVPRRVPRRCSRRSDPQGNSGIATVLTIRRGPRLRKARQLVRCASPRPDEGLKITSRERPDAAQLTAGRAGGTVAVSEKGGLKFLYAFGDGK
jgi:hypothetical protein